MKSKGYDPAKKTELVQIIEIWITTTTEIIEIITIIEEKTIEVDEVFSKKVKIFKKEVQNKIKFLNTQINLYKKNIQKLSIRRDTLLMKKRTKKEVKELTKIEK